MESLKACRRIPYSKAHWEGVNNRNMKKNKMHIGFGQFYGVKTYQIAFNITSRAEWFPSRERRTTSIKLNGFSKTRTPHGQEISSSTKAIRYRVTGVSIRSSR